MPIHRILGVLKEVGAFFVLQAVSFHGHCFPLAPLRSRISAVEENGFVAQARALVKEDGRAEPEFRPSPAPVSSPFPKRGFAFKTSAGNPRQKYFFLDCCFFLC